MLICFMPIIGC